MFFFKTIFSKIVKLFECLNKKNKNYFIFVNTRKRCLVLNEIIKKYYEKIRFLTLILTRNYSFKQINMYSGKIIFIGHNNKFFLENKYHNQANIINYDVPDFNNFLKRLKTIHNNNSNNFSFFVISDLKVYLDFIQFIFGIKKRLI
jgi:archaellin